MANTGKTDPTVGQKVNANIKAATTNIVNGVLKALNDAINGAINSFLGPITSIINLVSGIVALVNGIITSIKKTTTSIQSSFAKISDLKITENMLKDAAKKTALIAGGTLLAKRLTGSKWKAMSFIGQISAITSAVNGIMCIPSILNGLPGILGNVASSALSALSNATTGVLGAVIGSAGAAIENAICKLFNKPIVALLKLFADLVAIIAVVKAIVKLVEDLFDFHFNQENCRFAAAEIGKCLLANALSNISKRMLQDAQLRYGDGACAKLTKDAQAALNKPGNIIAKYMAKQSFDTNKAYSQVGATRII